MVYARYVCNNAFKEKFLFCSALETTKKAADILNKVTTFFTVEGLQWKNLAGCCIDDMPAMSGCNSDFQASVKRQAPKSKSVHCMLHRQALAFKTLPDSLQKVLDQIIKIISFIKAGALNSCLFKVFCADMDSDHQVLHYYTPTRWLFKGNVMRKVLELREKLKAFCLLKGKIEYHAWLDNEQWVIFLAYLCDIFEQLNKLNLQMQGKNTNFIKFVDALKTFKAKLANWKRKAEIYNFAMFEKVDMLLDSREKSSMPKVVEKNIVKHLLNLQNKFDRYFPETGDEELDFVRNPFTFPVEKLSGECQEEFLELINDSGAKQE